MDWGCLPHQRQGLVGTQGLENFEMLNLQSMTEKAGTWKQMIGISFSL